MSSNKKTKIFSKSKYADIEAVDNENDSEEYINYEEKEIDENLEEAQIKADLAHERNISRQEALLKKYDRYVEEVSSEENLYDEDKPEIEEGQPRSVFMRINPTIQKFYLVRCKPSKEYLCILNIAKKYSKISFDDENRQFHSAYIANSNCGYFYIEAENSSIVSEVIKGIPNINKRSDFIPVPGNEITRTFIPPKLELNITKGRFVRIKGAGLYGGDLAQVVGVFKEKQSYEIRTVPRIDLYNNKKRPSPSLITEDELLRINAKYRIIRNSNTGITFLLYNNKRLRDGFIYMKIKSKRVEEVKNPDNDETEIFGGNSFIIKEYQLGDKVKILSGEYQNIVGIIVHLDKDDAQIKSKETDNILEVKTSCLEIHFDCNDNVRILEGKNRGVEGIIIKIDKNKNIATVFSGNHYFEVNMNSLGSSKKFFIVPKNEKKENSIFTKGNIVQTSKGLLGVVLKEANKGNVEVLNSEGSIKIYNEKELAFTKGISNDITYGSDGKKIRPKNIVKIIQGNNEGAIGSVFLIQNDVVFINKFSLNFEGKTLIEFASSHHYKSKTNINPENILVVKASNVIVENEDMERGNKKFEYGFRKYENDNHNDDNEDYKNKNIDWKKVSDLLNKQVRIIKGINKSKVGIVKSVDQTGVVVQMNNDGKMIKLQTNQIKKLN